MTLLRKQLKSNVSFTRFDETLFFVHTSDQWRCNLHIRWQSYNPVYIQFYRGKVHIRTKYQQTINIFFSKVFSIHEYSKIKNRFVKQLSTCPGPDLEKVGYNSKQFYSHKLYTKLHQSKGICLLKYFFGVNSTSWNAKNVCLC